MKIHLSGISAELFNSSFLEINENFSRVSELKKYLISKKPELSPLDMRIAINSKLADENTKMNDEDIVLVFHPYAGG